MSDGITAKYLSVGLSKNMYLERHMARICEITVADENRDAEDKNSPRVKNSSLMFYWNLDG